MKSTFRRPDVKGTRFRPKKMEILNRSFCKKLRIQHPELQAYTDRQIKDIVRSCNEVVRKKAAVNREGVEFPEQLGYLFVGSVPATKAGNVDYKKSLELGVKVRHQNWDTEGLTCKIFYTNFENKYRFRFHELWTFKANEDFKTEVSSVYPSRYNYYVKVDNFISIAKLYRKRLKEAGG